METIYQLTYKEGKKTIKVESNDKATLKFLASYLSDEQAETVKIIKVK